jgi:hypothetical protein
MSQDYHTTIKTNVLNQETFRQASFKGARKKHPKPTWVKVDIRPVLLKDKYLLQFAYFDGRQMTTKNYLPAEATHPLDALLKQAFNNLQVENSTEKMHIQFTKKGKAIIHRGPVSNKADHSLRHNRSKQHPLPNDQPDAFLQTIGIMTQAGQVKASRQAKFRQINQFLQLVEHTGELEQFNHSPLNIIDFGCGNAHLTFAVYHYLNHILQIPATLTGVDSNATLIKKHTKLIADLGWSHLTFAASKIIDFQPATPPDIVFALHACDTATDEALAQAIKAHSKVIFCAPCCHHHLQQQLDQQVTPASFQAVMQHGILKERQGDILTDAFRATILRMLGYRTEVIQFISSEHTAKNLLIRAVKTTTLNQSAIAEYQALKQFWQVTPYLETLVNENLTALLNERAGKP